MRNKLAITIVSIVLVIVAVIGARAYTNYSENQPRFIVEGDFTGNYNEAAREIEMINEPANELGAAFTDFSETCVNWNGEMRCTYTGDLADATTTLIRIPTPFSNATTTNPADQRLVDFTGTSISSSTVVNIRLLIDGPATSSANIACGASSNGYDAPDVELLNAFYSTSTIGIIENNIATSTTDGTVGGGDVAKIHLTESYPYFLCDVAAPYEDDQEGAWTEVTNTFTGKYVAEIRR